jgi:hypothetical protein
LELTAIDTTIGTFSDEMSALVLKMIPTDPRKTMQLPSQLHVLVDGKYELSSNIQVSDGLSNGTSGSVKHVELASTNNEASGTIWMQ